MLFTLDSYAANSTKNKKVKVLSTNDSWFGLTYPQDSEQVDEKVTALFTKKR